MGRADEYENILPSLDELWEHLEELKKHCYRQNGMCEHCPFYKETAREEGHSYGFCRIKHSFPR